MGYIRMFHMITYDLKLFIRSVKGVLPFIIMCVFLGITYNPNANTDMYAAVVSSCLFSFYILMYIGYILTSNELDVSEQCVYIRCKNKSLYYICKALCIFILSVFSGFVLIAAACVFSNGDGNILTVVVSFLLVVCSGFCGGSLGQMFHPVIIRDRKLAAVLVVLVALLCACQSGIINIYPYSRYIFVLLPPIGSFEYINTITDIISAVSVIKESLIFLTYAIVYELIKSCVWNYKKYAD